LWEIFFSCVWFDKFNTKIDQHKLPVKAITLPAAKA